MIRREAASLSLPARDDVVFIEEHAFAKRSKMPLLKAVAHFRPWRLAAKCRPMPPPRRRPRSTHLSITSRMPDCTCASDQDDITGDAVATTGAPAGSMGLKAMLAHTSYTRLHFDAPGGAPATILSCRPSTKLFIATLAMMPRAIRIGHTQRYHTRLLAFSRRVAALPGAGRLRGEIFRFSRAFSLISRCDANAAPCLSVRSVRNDESAMRKSEAMPHGATWLDSDMMISGAMIGTCAPSDRPARHSAHVVANIRPLPRRRVTAGFLATARELILGGAKRSPRPRGWLPRMPI